MSMGRPASRKASRQRSISDSAKPRMEELGGSGIVNQSFEKEEIYGGAESLGEEEDDWAIQADLDLILDKKLLETITENQNSPYSTQASHCKSRRESAQSIFASMEPGPRRGSLPTKEPFNGAVLEVEDEDEGRRVGRSRSHSLATESLTGSHRSRESGVGSLGGDSFTGSREEVAKSRLVVQLPGLELNSLKVQPEEEEEEFEQYEQEEQKPAVSEAVKKIQMEDEEETASPSLPKR